MDLMFNNACRIFELTFPNYCKEITMQVLKVLCLCLHYRIYLNSSFSSELIFDLACILNKILLIVKSCGFPIVFVSNKRNFIPNSTLYYNCKHTFYVSPFISYAQVSSRSSNIWEERYLHLE
jgi:hypothetical protein